MKIQHKIQDLAGLVRGKAIALEEPDLATGAVGDQMGSLEGYAARWSWDTDGERFEQGCFDLGMVAQGKVALMAQHLAHGGGPRDVIGKVLVAEQRPEGLWIEAVFSGTQDAQALRQKTREGMVGGLSVGFVPTAHKMGVTPAGGRGKIITAARLIEVTLCLMPANVDATVTAAKRQAERLVMAKRRDWLAALRVGPLAILPRKPKASEAEKQMAQLDDIEQRLRSPNKNVRWRAQDELHKLDYENPL